MQTLGGTDVLSNQRNTFRESSSDIREQSLLVISALVLVCCELYEGSGGDQVDGLPPAPSCLRSAVPNSSVAHAARFK
eukprot:4315013-Pyramimonas_sp.AAC.1